MRKHKTNILLSCQHSEGFRLVSKDRIIAIDKQGFVITEEMKQQRRTIKRGKILFLSLPISESLNSIAYEPKLFSYYTESRIRLEFCLKIG